MKFNKLIKRSLALVLVFTLFLFSAMISSSAATVANDEFFSYFTLDAMGAAYRNSSGGANINGLNLGSANGVALEINTEYTFTFKMRMDARHETDNGSYLETHNARTPMPYIYPSGMPESGSFKPITPTYSIVGDYDDDWLSGNDLNLRAYNIPLGVWYTYTTTFTTAERQQANTWIGLVTYGGYKVSYGELTFTKTATGETTVYSAEDLNLPEVGNYRNTAETYTGVPTDNTLKFPQVDISSTKLTTEITVDCTPYNYKRPSGSGASLNGVKIGSKQGLNLERGETYTVNFEYRLDEILRPADGKNDGIYDCRTPIVQVYKDGKNPTSALEANSTFVGTITVNSAKNVNPWNLVNGGYVGKWISVTFTFTTTDAPQNADWIALCSWGGMKSSFRNLVVTDSENNKTVCSLGKVTDYDLMNTNTYSVNNLPADALAPSVDVSTVHNDNIGDVNGDGDTNILDIVRLKKYIAGVSGATVDNIAADISVVMGIDSSDLVALRKIL